MRVALYRAEFICLIATIVNYTLPNYSFVREKIASCALFQRFGDVRIPRKLLYLVAKKSTLTSANVRVRRTVDKITES